MTQFRPLALVYFSEQTIYRRTIYDASLWRIFRDVCYDRPLECFCSVVSFFLLSFVSSSFFPRRYIISAVADWLSTILLHMVWPWCEFRMQVWNMLHAARWKCRTQKIAKKSPSGHHRTILSGYIFPTKLYIDNRKKCVKQQYLRHMSSQYGELRPTKGWDPFGSLGHPSKFQLLSRLGSVTARRSSSGRQSNFVTLNTGRHLYSAGRPSRYALTHILV